MPGTDKQGLRPRRRATLASWAFCLLMLAAVGSALYVTSSKPSAAEACIRSCAADGKQGRLVYTYSQEQTAGVRGRGPAQCECR